MTYRAPEPKKTAAALRYRRARDAAPHVSAAGQGAVAERIIEVAREHGIPLREDPDLAGTLAALDISTEIPPELYVVIAQVLAWAYRTNSDYAKRAEREAGGATVNGWRQERSPPAT